ncbi:MAG: phage major capsid protein [Undibacterium umbellatum]|uniref:phage major capsid protein n=1 Tax=Undibacterium umbellatum TaxID=2762300 RepID=UPI003BB5C1B6
MSIQALRNQKRELHRQANKLVADKGEQLWTVEDQKTFDNLADQMERIDKQIESQERLLNLAAEKNFEDAKQLDADSPKNAKNQGYDLFLRKQFKDLSSEEMAIIRNTMSTTTGSQGGYTVPTDVSASFIEALKDFGGIRRVSDRFVTESGNDMGYPSTDGTAEMGEILAQNAQANSADVAFGTVPLSVQKFSSKVVAIPIELLQDSKIDVASLVQNRLRDRIGRIQNLKFTQGSGTNEPMGLVTASGVGKIGTTGQTATIIYDDLVDMIDSIDMAYLSEGMLTWNFGQGMRKVVRKIKDTTGRPIWTPNYDTGIAGELTDQLLGFPVNINNDMPAPGANAKSLSFGQHKKYMVRDVMEITLFRFDDSAYATKGQVGFLAFARAGGNLLDTSGVKVYQHSAS